MPTICLAKRLKESNQKMATKEDINNFWQHTDYTFNKSLKLTNSWIDTGIKGSDIPSGVYIITVDNFHSGATGLWSECYAGIVSWWSGNTNSGNATNIYLHTSGHADNSSQIQLRTLRHGGQVAGGVSLQIYCNENHSTAANIRFRFKKIMSR